MQRVYGVHEVLLLLLLLVSSLWIFNLALLVWSLLLLCSHAFGLLSWCTMLGFVSALCCCLCFALGLLSWCTVISIMLSFVSVSFCLSCLFCVCILCIWGLGFGNFCLKVLRVLFRGEVGELEVFPTLGRPIALDLLCILALDESISRQALHFP